MSKIENVSAKSGRTTKKSLSWTDEETALLLQVIIDYKSSKAALGLDWETFKSKYDDICERLQSRYPKERDESDPEEYPHYTDPSVITREKITPKIVKFLIFSLCFLSKITASKVFSLATATKDDNREITHNNLSSCTLSMITTVGMTTTSNRRKKVAALFKYHVMLY